MELKKLNDFVLRLQATSSRKEKESILSEADTFQKEVLKFLFDPFVVTGISKKKLANFKGKIDVEPLDLLALLRYLRVYNTGSNADVKYALDCACSSEFPELVLSIVRKDLRLGVNAVTLNKVFGKNFIPVFQVQLAERYFDDPDKYVPEGSRFVLTEKLDGVRCVLIFDEQGCPHFYSRAGKEFEALADLEREAIGLNTSFVYDGELLIDKQDSDSNALYRQTMSVVGSDGIKQGVVFNVFDIVKKDCFKNSVPYEVKASVRKEMVRQELGDRKWIRSVPILYTGDDRSQIEEVFLQQTFKGAEGIMINLDDAPYIPGRNPGLLKVKRFKECEAFVKEIVTGTGKNSHVLGAVIADIKDESGRFHTVRVGSGFSDLRRKYYFKHQQELIGKVVEIGYFEVTSNQTDDSLSLRFPTWLDRVRCDKDLDSMTPISLQR